MLRSLVLLLVLLNGAYFAWSQGFLLGYGFGPLERSESQRLEQQIQPQAITLLDAEAARRLEGQWAASAAASGRTCWRAGPFDEAQAQVLRRALESLLPQGSWLLEPALLPGRWIVYMGRYETAEAVIKKRSELRFLNVPTEPLRNPALEPGLSLGGFETQAQAGAALGELAQRGVRTARVVQERAEPRGQQLRLPQADDALRAQFDSVRPTLSGRILQPCPA